MTRLKLVVAVAGILAPVTLVSASAPMVVNQVDRAFSLHEISIRVGDIIRFSNADEFIHHIYVASPDFNFNSGEQPPGSDVDVQFPVTGYFEVRCEVHPKMLLKVSVR